MEFYVIFIYFGGRTSPKMGQSTSLLKNHLKVLIPIKINTLNPNLHVISSDYKYVKRYGGFRGGICPQNGAKYHCARKSFENIRFYQNRYAESDFVCYFIKL